MIEIPLTNSDKKALVDDCFAHLLNYKWRLSSTGYAIRNIKRNPFAPRKIWLHHVVPGRPLYGKFTDHKNGDRLDNRSSNLGIVTIRQNQQNMKCHRNGSKTSKYLGVCWNKSKKRWRADIRLSGKGKTLGVFRDELKAAEAYQNALRMACV